MEFFKPTWKKLLIAIILTVWPYLASFIFVLHAGDGNIFSDPILQLSFWLHSWYWSPLYLIVQFIPHLSNNKFWQSDTFLFVVYPALRFAIRYLVACVIIFFAHKLAKKHGRKNTNYSSA